MLPTATQQILAENHDKEIKGWKKQVEAAASLDDVKKEADVSKWENMYGNLNS